MVQGMTAAMTLLLASCTTAPEKEIAMTDTPLGCSVEGDVPAGLDVDMICSALRDGFIAGGGDKAMEIAVVIVSDARADAKLTDQLGGEITSLTLDIADTSLNESAFRRLGNDLAMMASKHSDKAT
ncbi:MAG: hypothetical protein R3E14_09935 [Erythrobacter sp.]